MHKANKRSYLDPIHHDIILDRTKPAEKLVIDLIDTQEFQRLRRVHQLGVSYFTFQGAEGSRFTHCVGVMSIASRLTDIFSENTPSVEAHRAVILASALLHDLGHGPFSHVTEKILDYDHEDWSCRIISSDTEVNQVLSNYKHEDNLATKIVKVLKKQYAPKYLSHMVSSQLDCDRFDYLLRDSYMTGTEYGLFALPRILRSMEIDEQQDRIVVAGEKGQIAVEDYLFARYSMYAQVYYHKKNLAARALLAKIIKRACALIQTGSISFVDPPTRKWLTGAQLNVAEYLTLDDVQLNYHIKQWLSDPDPILSDLSHRFLHRKLFKAVRIPLENDPAKRFKFIEEVEREACRLVKDSGFDPEYYVSTESNGFRPYDFYRPDSALPQTNIIIRTDTDEMRELSELSPTVEALVKGNYQSHWLIYPAEISEKISRIRELIPARRTIERSIN